MSELPEMLERALGGHYWILKVFVIVLIVLLANFFIRRFLIRLKKQLEKTKNPWDDALINAAQKPIAFGVWVVGLTFAAQVVVAETGSELFELGTPMRAVGVIFAVGWFLNRLIRELEHHYIEHQKSVESDQAMDRATIEAFGKLLRLAVIITAAIVILQTLGFSISGVLAFGGIGGIAIGFAAKDLLSNFFGGLMIYLDRPFSVGDWISSPDRQIEGTVEYIGWRLTRIRTFDLRPLYIPNSIFTNIVVENPSRMQHRRLYETIGVRYDDIAQMDAIVRDVQNMLESHDEINEKQTLMVNFNAFAPSSVDFFIYAFTHTTGWAKYHGIKQEILLKISDIIASHGAEIAYPTQTLHIASSSNTHSNDS
ncbi:MAG: mechanosensitive ion channel family protein [Pseudomonadota bacterium]